MQIEIDDKINFGSPEKMKQIVKEGVLIWLYLNNECTTGYVAECLGIFPGEYAKDWLATFGINWAVSQGWSDEEEAALKANRQHILQERQRPKELED